MADGGREEEPSKQRAGGEREGEREISKWRYLEGKASPMIREYAVVIVVVVVEVVVVEVVVEVVVWSVQKRRRAAAEEPMPITVDRS